MPRDPFLPPTRQEQRLIIHFLREGATPEAVPVAARKAKVSVAEAKAILKRKHVQEEIRRRKVLVEYEENRLIAKDSVTQTQRDDERDMVTLHKIESALDKVIGLDADKHGQTVLKAIELGLIYTGHIRDGNKVKLQTVDPLGQDKKPDGSGDGGEMKPREDGFYASIFAGMREQGGGGEGGGSPAPAELMPEEEPAPAPPKPPPPPVKAAAKPKAEAHSGATAAKKTSPQIEIT